MNAQKDLIIRARVESLRSSLLDVADAVEKAERRNQALNDIGTAASDAQAAVQDIWTKYRLADVYLDTGNIDDAKGQVAEIKNSKAFERAMAQLETIVDAIGEIHDRAYRGLDSTARQRTVRTTLVNEANELDWKLKPLSTSTDSEASAAWHTITTDILPRIPELYEDYVDLVRGIAVRDSGLDAGMCALADELMRGLDEGQIAEWQSLTVPSLVEAISVDLTRIIRLGFGDWSMWSVPTAAAQYGQLLARKPNEPFDEAIAKPFRKRLGATNYPTLVSDAFATYVVGPAYAAASIVLKLRPVVMKSGRSRQHRNDDATRLEKQRAAVVLGMLRQMSPGVTGGAFGIAHAQLRDAWNAALAQNDVDEGLKSKDHLDEFVNKMHGFLSSHPINEIGYTDQWFDQVSGWPDDLLDWYQRRDDPAPKVPDRGIDLSTLTDDQRDVRHVLNTAWLCRLNQPDRTDEIRTAARALLADIKVASGTVGERSLASTPRDTKSFGSAKQ